MNKNQINLADTNIRNILIVCDNFWIGGRETFVSDTLSLLRKHGLQRAYLIANNIRNPAIIDIFDGTAEVGTSSEYDIASWIQTSQRLFSSDSTIDLVWVQHYSSLAGFFLAQTLSAKLHITLHGPPLSSALLAGADALGLSLAIHRGASMSGVSQEILKQISVFSTDDSHQTLLANKVICSHSITTLPCRLTSEESSRTHTLKLAMFTRQGKLNHIRSAATLVAQFLKQGVPCQLTIYTGISPEVDITKASNNPWRVKLRLLGKKWLLRNLNVAFAMKHIRVRPLTAHVKRAIQESDIVLGMGRVILEGLSNHRVCILIGYDELIGVVNSENFEKYQTTNFSGRNQRPQLKANIVAEALEKLASDEIEFEALKLRVDIENACLQFEQWAKSIGSTKKLILNQGSAGWIDLLSSTNSDNRSQNPRVLSLLTDNERETFAILSEKVN